MDLVECNEIRIVKRRSNISKSQKRAMFEFLNQNDHLVNATSGDFTRNDARLKWIELAEILNNIPGSRKNWKDWRKTWHDLRSKNRSKNVQVYDESKKNWVPIQTKKMPTRNKNISEEQKEVMMEFIKNNPRLIGTKFSPDFRVIDARNKWQELTEILNSMSGAKKSWKRWRKTWHDLSHRSKIKNIIFSNSNIITSDEDLGEISASVKIEDIFQDTCESFRVEVESNSPSLPDGPDPLFHVEQEPIQSNNKNEDILVKLVNICTQSKNVKEDYYKKKLELYERIANALEALVSKR